MLALDLASFIAAHVVSLKEAGLSMVWITLALVFTRHLFLSGPNLR
jgi:hypothetical protein